jgi:hypothetical protein
MEIIRKFQGDYENSFHCILLPEWWTVIDWNVEMQHTVGVPDYTSFRVYFLNPWLGLS